jgi:hypothetical protein
LDVHVEARQVGHAGHALDPVRPVGGEEVHVDAPRGAGEGQAGGVLVPPAVRKRDGAGHQVGQELHGHADGRGVGGHVCQRAVGQPRPGRVVRVHVEVVGAHAHEVLVVVGPRVVGPRVVGLHGAFGDQLEARPGLALALEVGGQLLRLLEEDGGVEARRRGRRR